METFTLAATSAASFVLRPATSGDVSARSSLTSDKSRTGAHRFYRRLGFVASHEGMKLAP
ncbi:MAG TPA: hypothetical protein VGI66_13950 [Streptosporangiaceae bacterium]|jgi:hypothetical protein